MTSWLVTGGEGFIGGTIVRLSGATSYDLKSGENILDTEKLSSVCGDVNGIFHCAAKISVPESIERPDEYYLNNVEGTKSVIQAAKNAGAGGIKSIFSSSAAVYGESNHPVKEEEVLSPLSPYAENKRDGEVLLRESGLPAVILRYFNVYGPGQSAAYAGVITAFIRAALKGDDLIINGDGEQVRDFIFVEDVARANIAAMESDIANGQTFNIGSGTKTSINELAEEILRLTNSTSKIIYAPARAGDIVYSQADVSKAKEILNWSADVGISEGLQRTIEFYKRV
ncbi:MAG: NDP-sugar dehydratase or epimerase [Parcubacteria group bacterium]|nr:NDP-sugar dehydratase or epimerase [Parcubacteria group bacterium]